MSKYISGSTKLEIDKEATRIWKEEIERSEREQDCFVYLGDGMYENLNAVTPDEAIVFVLGGEFP